MSEQHERIELFYKSKVTEIRGGLIQFSKELSPAEPSQAHDTQSDRRVAAQRRERRARREGEIRRIGQELEALSRYAAAQKAALTRLLEKYRKGTSSATLEARLASDLFRKSKILQGKETSALLAQYTKVLATVPSPSRPTTSTTLDSVHDALSVLPGSSATSVNGPPTPGHAPPTAFDPPPASVDRTNDAAPAAAHPPPSRDKGKSKAPEPKPCRERVTAPPIFDAPAAPRYWNEFDDDAPHAAAPYTISVDPNATDPISDLAARVARGTAATLARVRVRGWLRHHASSQSTDSPTPTPHDPERQPLVAHDYFSFQPQPPAGAAHDGPQSAPAQHASFAAGPLRAVRSATYATFSPRPRADDADSTYSSLASSRSLPPAHPLFFPRVALAFYVAAFALCATVAGVEATRRRHRASDGDGAKDGGGDGDGDGDGAREDWGAAAGVAGSVALATAGLVLAWLRREDEERAEGRRRRRRLRRAVAAAAWALCVVANAVLVLGMVARDGL